MNILQYIINKTMSKYTTYIFLSEADDIKIGKTKGNVNMRIYGFSGANKCKEILGIVTGDLEDDLKWALSRIYTKSFVQSPYGKEWYKHVGKDLKKDISNLLIWLVKEI